MILHSDFLQGTYTTALTFENFFQQRANSNHEHQPYSRTLATLRAAALRHTFGTKSGSFLIKKTYILTCERKKRQLYSDFIVGLFYSYSSSLLII